MKKSFKRSIAVLLSVIMAATTMPLSALAAAGEYKPDIQLQFGTFWNASAGSPLNQENQYDYDYSLSGIYGPVVDYKNGALVLDADKYATWNESFGNEDITDSYTLQTGDIFTVTARLDNVSKISAFEAAISYSNNIAPLVDDDWDVDGTTPFLSDSIYDGLNDGLLGNLSYVDAEKNVMIVSAAAAGDYADVSETAVTGITDPATGATNYNCAGKAMIVTFVFQIVDAGPITFGIYNGAEDEDTTYGGAYYIADVNDGTDPEDYTTYEPVDDAIGSTDITFLSKNEYNAPSGYTITFIDATGATISSATYEEGADVTIPELPKMTNTTTKHTTYAWDKTPSATATADATYTIVATTADHNYTSEVVTPATCDKKGSTKYTCQTCAHTFTVQDIAATGKHTPADAVKENEVPATCQAAGSYDSVVYCSACGTKISSTKITVDPTDHAWGEWTYLGDAGVTSTTANGNEERECAVCHTKETQAVKNTGALRVRNRALLLSNGISMKYNLTEATYNAFDEVYAIVSKYSYASKSYVETRVEWDGKTKETIGSTKYNTFIYNGLAPQNMMDEIKVVFYGVRDGKTYYGSTYSDSVITYVNALMGQSDTKTKALLVDMLNYGAAAQVYQKYNTENPANAGLTEELKALAAKESPAYSTVEANNYYYEPFAGETMRFRGYGLSLGAQVKPQVNFTCIAGGTTITEDMLKNMKFKVVLDDKNSTTLWYNYAENPELFEPYIGTSGSAVKGRYILTIPDIKTSQSGSYIFITMYDMDGNQLSATAKIGATANYTNAMKTNDPRTYTLCDAMMKYAKTCAAYAGFDFYC